MSSKKIDRDIIVKLPASALNALRKDIAQSVMDGIEDGFKKSKKSKKRKSTKNIAEEEATKIKKADLPKEIDAAGASMKSFKAGLGKATAVIAAVTTAIEMFMTIMKSIEERSKQLITHDSLFTDKGIMDLMQRTGQSATDATATQRALDSLGITLEDLQSGKITQTQMEAFQELRASHIESLERVSVVSEGMNQAWQGLALHITTITTQFKDRLTEILGGSGVIERLVAVVKPLADAIFMIMETLTPLITMLLNILIPVINYMANYIKMLLIPLQMLMPVLEVVAELITNITMAFDELTTWFFKATGWIWDLLGIKVPSIDSASTNINNSVTNQNRTSTVNNYNQPNNNLFTNDYTAAN